MCELQQLAISGAVVKPDHDQSIILPAESSPVPQRTPRQRLQLMVEVSRQYGDLSRVPGNLLILREYLEHNHARPPVVIAGWAEHSVRRLVVQCPVDVFLRL